MKVKELREWLNQFKDNEDVVFTSMDDNFYCDNVELHSPYDDGQAQEIILPYYIEKAIEVKI